MKNRITNPIIEEKKTAAIFMNFRNLSKSGYFN
jgi:hypothetical protein